MNPRRAERPDPPETARADARDAEERFFERLAARMAATAGIYDPLSRRTWDASPRNRVTKSLEERSTEVKAAVKRLAERDLMKIYEDMPGNAVVLHEILHRELLGRPQVKVVVAGAAFSPVEDLVVRGASSRPIEAAELARVRAMVVRHDAVFYYMGAFSTTGWAASAEDELAGPNWLVALSDQRDGAWRTRYAPDERWTASARLFDLSSEEEKVDAIRRWVKAHTAALIMDELTEDAVFDALGYAVPLIRRAFASIAREDPFVRYDATGRPHRLVRTYG
jgi:hypothetical protein